MSEPVRTCIGCGGKAPQRALVRLRIADGGRVDVDVAKRGGRGAWLHPAQACVARAVRRGAVARAFRRGDLGWDGDAVQRVLTAVGSRD